MGVEPRGENWAFRSECLKQIKDRSFYPDNLTSDTTNSTSPPIQPQTPLDNDRDCFIQFFKCLLVDTCINIMCSLDVLILN